MVIRRILLASALLLFGCGTEAPVLDAPVSGAPLSFAWPPTAGERYPDLELLDMDGQTVQLSSFEGQVLLIEPIGMT